VRKARLQCTDGLLYQSRPVVERDNSHFRHRPVSQCFLRHSGIHLMYLFFHIINYFQRIGAITGNHHAPHSLYSFLVQAATSRPRSDIHKGNIGNTYGYPFTDVNNRILYICHIFHIPKTTNQVFHFIHLHCFGTNIKVTLLHSIHHIHHRHIERVHRIRIQLDLILLDKTSC